MAVSQPGDVITGVIQPGDLITNAADNGPLPGDTI